MKRRKLQPVPARQGGAVIIVVLALLSSLAFLGFFFYSWTDMEANSAVAWSEQPLKEADSDAIHDFALQQVLVSTPGQYVDSALFGSYWSILSNTIGRVNSDGTPSDVNPHSGRGITIRYIDTVNNTTGVAPPDGIPDLTLDLDGDGTPDTPGFIFDHGGDNAAPGLFDQDDYVLNLSAAANGGVPYDTTLGYDFQPDAGYTYPDVNSLFLAYDAWIPPTASTPVTRVITPSFFRPQLLPQKRVDGFSDVFSDATTANKVLRPHVEHSYTEDLNGNGMLDPGEDFNGNGTGPDTIPRYLTAAFTQARSGDRNRLIAPFPMTMGGEMGIFTGSGDDYELDVDADGDGVLDSIWLDLDHPIVNLPDGRQAVPMFYIKIIDTDGLLNLNAHGSADLTYSSGFTHPFGLDTVSGQAYSITTSNLGLSPSEVNPTWALFAQPHNASHLDPAHQNYAFSNHAGFFGFTPAAYFGGAATSSEKMTVAANMELGFLLFGGGISSSTAMLPGRWGEPGLIVPGTSVPRPGETLSDDDQDANSSIAPGNDNSYGGFPCIDNDLQGLTVPPYVHPLDFRGIGEYLDRTAPSGAERFLATNPVANNPSTWPAYDANWQNQGSFPMTWQGAIAGALQSGAIDGLTDEGDETYLDYDFYDTDDAPFPPGENAALHLSESHWNKIGLQARVRELAPFNFRDSRVASEIRKQFGTDSWDRLEFTQAPLPVPGIGTARAWERTAWTHPSVGNFQSAAAFPPQFSGAAAGTTLDPFRPELRLLLKTETSNSSNIGAARFAPRHRLNINRVLSDDTAPYNGFDAFDANANPQYRNLVPHADFTGAAIGSTIPPMVHDNSPAMLPYPFTAIAADPVAQEWWARYDRQRLARDIYVLLYTIAGLDADNATTSAHTEDLDGDGIPDRVREFAQFAVNYVDNLDRDHVVTRFEYDINLADGWGAPSAVVHGIESQQLVFSEVLWVKAADLSGSGGNNPDTFWDDSDAEHNFLYIELRNTSPFNVPLDEETWRIVRQPTSLVGSAQNANDGELAFLDPCADVGPGQNFIIAMHDNTITVPTGPDAGDVRSSTLYVDHDAMDVFKAIVPFNVPDNDPGLPTDENGDHPAPLADLDVSFTNGGTNDHATHFALSAFTGGSGGGTLVAADDGAADFDLVLQRRAHLNTDGAIALTDADWIEVDRVNVLAQTLNVSGGVSTAVQNLRSTEWDEPFRVRIASTTPAPGAVYPVRGHTIGGPAPRGNPVDASTDPDNHLANSALRTSGESFHVWEPHFDRDYSSIYELLSLPLYGVRTASSTENLQDPDVLGGSTENLAQNASPPVMSGHRTAAVRIFNPQGVDDGTGTFVALNRWYRLFEFIDVPSRSNLELRDRYALQRRVPGLINLNTLRHDPVMAALVDDPQIRRFGDGVATVAPDFTTTFPSDNVGFDTGRNWFMRLLVARDGEDTISGGFPLPGVPAASRPFLGMSYIDPNNPDQSLRNTILRGHNISGPPNPLNNLQLFEARASADADGNAANGENAVDFHTRHRLLSKIANNTTNRSHVFMMWIGYELFEAHQPNAASFPNIVQIGARIDNVPGHREFVVVDMTRLEEAYSDPDPTDAVPGRFDWRKFIIYRKRIQ